LQYKSVLKCKILLTIIRDKKERLKTTLDVKCGDFDGTKFHITSKGLSKNDLEKSEETLIISIFVIGYKTCKDCGCEDMIKKTFGDIIKIEDTESEYSLTLSFNMDQLKDEEKSKFLFKDSEKVLLEMPQLKRHVMMSPFVKTMNSFIKKEKFEPITFQYRQEESIYFILIDGSINLIFSIKFDDPDDITIAKVLLTVFFFNNLIRNLKMQDVIKL
jgi:hypothetical protein